MYTSEMLNYITSTTQRQICSNTVNSLYNYTFEILKTFLKKCDYNENVTIKGFYFI